LSCRGASLIGQHIPGLVRREDTPVDSSQSNQTPPFSPPHIDLQCIRDSIRLQARASVNTLLPQRLKQRRNSLPASQPCLLTSTRVQPQHRPSSPAPSSPPSPSSQSHTSSLVPARAAPMPIQNDSSTQKADQQYGGSGGKTMSSRSSPRKLRRLRYDHRHNQP
jgi:hypothetical protein